jgi:hypothetical protein
MGFDSGGFGQAGTGLGGGGGGTPGATTLATLLDVNLGTLANNEVLTYNFGSGKWENKLGGSFAGSIGTLALRPATPLVDTLYIVSGDTTTINNGRAFIYLVANTTWTELATSISTRKLDELFDVDLTTTPPANKASIIYNSTSQKWETSLESFTQEEIGFSSPAPPAFTDILPGTIWIDNATFDQYIYVIDGGGNPLWITLGSSSGGGGGGATILDELLDVDLTTTPPVLNNILKYNGSLWVPGTGGGGASTLNDLTDVDTLTTPPVNTNLLQFNGTNWVPISFPTIPSNINSLSDVDTTTTPPASNDVLKFDGTNWIPGANTPSITNSQVIGTSSTVASGTWTTIASLTNVNGTCLFSYNIRYAGSSSTVLKSRLYNNTASSAIANSEVYISRNGLGIDEGSYTGTFISTLGALSTIQLQVYVTGSACDIKSDSEGRTLINYIRIS